MVLFWDDEGIMCENRVWLEVVRERSQDLGDDEAREARTFAMLKKIREEQRQPEEYQSEDAMVRVDRLAMCRVNGRDGMDHHRCRLTLHVSCHIWNSSPRTLRRTTINVS